jgi:hypothetical protein
VAAKLNEAMGPIAPILLTDHIRALGETAGSFPNAKLEELVKAVSREILDEVARARFAKEMFEEIKKTTEYSTAQSDRPVTADSAVSSKKANGKRSRPARAKPPAILNPAASQVSQDGLPPGFLDIVRVKLGEAMGPMASMVLRDHIRALGESFDSFPEAKLEQLSKRVSEEILDDYHRARFTNEIAKEVKKLNDSREQGAWS